MPSLSCASRFPSVPLSLVPLSPRKASRSHGAMAILEHSFISRETLLEISVSLSLSSPQPWQPHVLAGRCLPVPLYGVCRDLFCLSCNPPAFSSRRLLAPDPAHAAGERQKAAFPVLSPGRSGEAQSGVYGWEEGLPTRDAVSCECRPFRLLEARPSVSALALCLLVFLCLFLNSLQTALSLGRIVAWPGVHRFFSF